MGLWEEPGGAPVCPKIKGHLQAIVFGHHPVHAVSQHTVRELQALATALDALEEGSLAEAADALMQRFKALELSLSDGNWKVAAELEVATGVRPTLASQSEQEAARRSAMLR